MRLSWRIVSLRDHLSFFSGDGFSVLNRHREDADAVCFIDPPYTAGENGKRAGQRLYAHNELDHEHLFDFVSQIQGDFLMTYDNAKDVRQTARRYHFDMRLVPMKNTHHTNMAELLIGRDLSWLNLPQPENDLVFE